MIDHTATPIPTKARIEDKAISNGVRVVMFQFASLSLEILLKIEKLRRNDIVANSIATYFVVSKFMSPGFD